MADTVLVVDDETNLRFALRLILEDAGLRVLEAPDGQQALEVIERDGDVDLVITDLTMPRMDGLTLLRAIRKDSMAPPVVMITGRGSERVAVEAIQIGALDYFPKPFDESEILHVVHRCLGTARTVSEARRTKAAADLGRTMVFESKAMERVAMLVQRVARRDVSVLVTGESGTGKELVAQAIVAASDRRHGPFLRFSCAALHDELAGAELFGHRRGAFTGAVGSHAGLFREADGGSMLLDEVGELSPRAQGMLLRVLQEREVRPVGASRGEAVDVRVIAATNRELSSETGFRQDLYFRLRGLEIVVPPLRERKEDIIPLARHFVSRACERFGIDRLSMSTSLERQLREQDWAGNVRELQHLVESLVVLADEPLIGLDTLNLTTRQRSRRDQGLSLKQKVDAFEQQLLARVLEDCDGNQSEAARRLQVSRMTLSSKLKKYGLR